MRENEWGIAAVPLLTGYVHECIELYFAEYSLLIIIILECVRYLTRTRLLFIFHF